MAPTFFSVDSGDKPPKELAAFACGKGWDGFIWQEKGEQSGAKIEPVPTPSEKKPSGDAFVWKRRDMMLVEDVYFTRVKEVQHDKLFFFVSEPQTNLGAGGPICFWFATDHDFWLVDYMVATGQV